MIKIRKNLMEFVEYYLRMEICMKDQFKMENSMALADLLERIKLIILVNLRMDQYMDMESFICLMGQFKMEFGKIISL